MASESVTITGANVDRVVPARSGIGTNGVPDVDPGDMRKGMLVAISHPTDTVLWFCRKYNDGTDTGLAWASVPTGNPVYDETQPWP